MVPVLEFGCKDEMETTAVASCIGRDDWRLKRMALAEGGSGNVMLGDVLLLFMLMVVGGGIGAASRAMS